MTAPTPIEELMVKPKFCSDCKFYRWSEHGRVFDGCDSPANYEPFDLVRGGSARIWAFCSDARRFPANGCGPDAKWFIAKRVTVEMDDACSTVGSSVFATMAQRIQSYLLP